MLSRLELRTKLLFIPLGTLLVTFLAGGYLMGARMDRALKEQQSAHLRDVSGMLSEAFEQRIRRAEVHLKVAALQDKLWEGYMTLVIEERDDVLRRFLDDIRNNAGARDVLAVDEKGQILSSFLPLLIGACPH